MIKTTEALVEPFITAARNRKVIELTVLDVHELTSVADAFIVCSGRSNRQVTAIADHIVRDLKKQGIRPLSVEGLKDGHWILIDYGDVIIHVFYEPVRAFYDLEGLWADARRIDVPDRSIMTPQTETEEWDD